MHWRKLGNYSYESCITQKSNSESKSFFYGDLTSNTLIDTVLHLIVITVYVIVQVINIAFWFTAYWSM